MQEKLEINAKDISLRDWEPVVTKSDERFINHQTGISSKQLADVVDTTKPFMDFTDSEFRIRTVREHKTYIYCYQISYIKNLNMIMIRCGRFESHILETTNQFDVEDVAFYLIDKDKNPYFLDDTGEFYMRKKNKNLSFCLFFMFNSDWIDSTCVRPKGKDNSINIMEFRKLFLGVYLNGSNVEKVHSSIYDIKQALMINHIKPINNDMQDMVDYLTSYELKEFDISDWGYSFRYQTYLKYIKLDKFELDGKQILVCRKFARYHEAQVWEDCVPEVYEIFRAYITDDDVIYCRLDNNGEWMYDDYNQDFVQYWGDGLIAAFNSDIFNGTRLMYSKKYFDFRTDFDKHFLLCRWTIGKIIAFARCKTLELLAKEGYSKIADNIFKVGYVSDVSVMNYLENALGTLNDGNNLNKILGFNNYQLKKIFEKLPYYLGKDKRYEIISLKIICDLDILPNFIYGEYFVGTALANQCEFRGSYGYIDNESFNKIFDFVNNELQEINDKIWNFKYRIEFILLRIHKMYGLKAMVKFIDNIKMISKTSVPRSNFIMIEDYLDMVQEMGDTLTFKPWFKDDEELKRLHDEALMLYNLKKETEIIEGFNERKTKWEDFVYSDDNYSVVYPNEAADIANEGITLHHCVKCYTERVAKGSTNIMFIRKASELDKPFFTAEVSNDGTIEQIHGFSNRNLSTEPELLYFIDDWAASCNLEKGYFDQVR